MLIEFVNVGLKLTFAWLSWVKFITEWAQHVTLCKREALASFLVKIVASSTFGLAEAVVYFEIIRCSLDTVRSFGVGVFIIEILR